MLEKLILGGVDALVVFLGKIREIGDIGPKKGDECFFEVLVLFFGANSGQKGLLDPFQILHWEVV